MLYRLAVQRRRDCHWFDSGSARHPVGSQPIIYYDPDAPSQSVLERKFNPAAAVFGLICGAFGCIVLYAVYFQ